jgi:hypothetical protein
MYPYVNGLFEAITVSPLRDHTPVPGVLVIIADGVVLVILKEKFLDLLFEKKVVFIFFVFYKYAIFKKNFLYL